MSVHIEAKPGEIAESIFLPGDPLRAKYIVENFLEVVECDGMTRLISGLLSDAGIKHHVGIGHVEDKKTGRNSPLHYWIELEDGQIVDYRVRMWLGIVWRDRMVSL